MPRRIDIQCLLSRVLAVALVACASLPSTAWAKPPADCETKVTLCEHGRPDLKPLDMTLPDGTLLRFSPTCTYGMSGGVVYDVFAITGDQCATQKLAVENHVEGKIERGDALGCLDLSVNEPKSGLIHCLVSGYRVYSYEPGILRLEEDWKDIYIPGPDPAMDLERTYKRKKK